VLRGGALAARTSARRDGGLQPGRRPGGGAARAGGDGRVDVAHRRRVAHVAAGAPGPPVHPGRWVGRRGRLLDQAGGRQQLGHRQGDEADAEVARDIAEIEAPRQRTGGRRGRDPEVGGDGVGAGHDDDAAIGAVRAELGGDGAAQRRSIERRATCQVGGRLGPRRGSGPQQAGDHERAASAARHGPGGGAVRSTRARSAAPRGRSG
jgi:hypothetical protein